MGKFQEHNIVTLNSKASSKNLRENDDHCLDGKGGDGAKSKWIVHRKGSSVALQNKKSDRFLKMKDDHVLRTGTNKDKYSWWNLHKNDNGTFSLESVNHPSHHVGVRDDGGIKKKAGRGRNGSFAVQVCQSKGAGGCGGKGGGGGGGKKLLRCGVTYLINSKVSHKNLRECWSDYTLETKAEESDRTKWIVHHKDGLYAFQNKKTMRFMKIKEGKLITGSNNCSKSWWKLRPDKNDRTAFALENNINPGQFLNSLSDGKTGPGGRTLWFSKETH